jgi:S1-C subfamily serine protease
VGALVGAIVATAATLGVAAVIDDDPEETLAAGTEFGEVQAILDRVQDSVVTIETSGYAQGSVFEGAGTGVVLSDDGLVLTNAHVIAASDDIWVRLFDGSRHQADLVGSAADNDLAVIRVEGAGPLRAATLGSSDDLEVGEPVVAIGNALNLGGRPSVTTGIVSATNRSFPTREGTFTGLIQTDAAINVGNSGGPLVDAEGEVVGINTAILAETQNIGFAIAISTARPIIEELEQGRGDSESGGSDRPLLGVNTVTLDAVDDATRSQFGITADAGAFIAGITPGSGAEDAGLTPGDVVVELDGETIESSNDLGEAVAAHEPGDEVEVVVERGGEETSITAEIGTGGG